MVGYMRVWENTGGSDQFAKVHSTGTMQNNICVSLSILLEAREFQNATVVIVISHKKEIK